MRNSRQNLLSFDAAKNFYPIKELTVSVFDQFFDYCLVF